MILILDNYDSFVFTIASYCRELGQTPLVVRNDRITTAEITQLKPKAILLSPGPCTPAEAGVSLATIAAFSGAIPILGICLGHQCIGEAFGGRVTRARVPMHGRASRITHQGEHLFATLPNPLTVGRYHSLVVEPSPAMLEQLSIDALSPEGEVMALSHREHPSYGVQFHPESILTEAGHALLKRFFTLADSWHAA